MSAAISDLTEVESQSQIENPREILECTQALGQTVRQLGLQLRMRCRETLQVAKDHPNRLGGSGNSSISSNSASIYSRSLSVSLFMNDDSSISSTGLHFVPLVSSRTRMGS